MDPLGVFEETNRFRRYGMKEKTSRFWFIATVMLAAMYLTSNPTLTSEVGSQLSELWRGVISRVKVLQPPASTESPEDKLL